MPSEGLLQRESIKKNYLIDKQIKSERKNGVGSESPDTVFSRRLLHNFTMPCLYYKNGFSEQAYVCCASGPDIMVRVG